MGLVRLIATTGQARDHALASSAGRVLEDCLKTLEPRAGVSPPWLLPYLKGLKKEKDPSLLFHGLLQIGARLKSENRLDASQKILSRLTQPDIPEEIRSRALSELEAMLGTGPTGRRVEYLLARFGEDATDPRWLIPMVGATVLGQAVRALALGRLAGIASRGNAGWIWGRGGARLAAGTMGFLSEVSAFTGIGRILSPTPTDALAEEGLRSALILGALRLSGGLGNKAARMLPTRPPNTLYQLSGRSIRHVSTFLGLAASRRIETDLGLREKMEESTFFVDTLASWANLAVGAHLANHLPLSRPRIPELKVSNRRSLPFYQNPLLAPMWMMMGMGPGGAGGGGSRKPPPSPPSHSLEGEAITRKKELLQPSTPPPYLGATIDGRYRVEALLGQGGMGMVFRCKHTIIGKTVAMKVLRPEFSQDPEQTERFLNEAKAASSIGSPHIIDISDFGRLPDGATYFMMEYLEGASLSQWVEGGKTVPIPRIIPVARQLAQGLAAAHRAGIVHRDLKPDNIFLVPREENAPFVKILDFGIAKVATSGANKLTRAGDVFGTPHYMSPEQAAGVGVDHRGDIYSFGIILYEMATGGVPFDAENFMSILNMQINHPPPPLHTRVAPPQVISPEFEAIVLKCLSKRPKDRYQSMDELIADLDKLQAGGVPDALPEMRARRRWPVVASLGGAGAAAILLGVLYAIGRTDTGTPVSSTLPGEIPDAQSTPAPTASVRRNEVVLSVQPRDAHVFQGDRDLGSDLLQISVEEGKPMELEIRREGYKPQRIVLDGTQAKLSFRLERETKTLPKPTAPAPPSAKAKDSGGSGEPFNPWK